MSTTSPPRDPSAYSPTTHAGQRVRDRGVEWADVAETIAEGEVRQTHHADRKMFVEDVAGGRLGVVVALGGLEVVTVEWKHR